MKVPATPKKHLALPLWIIAFGLTATYAGASDMQKLWIYRTLEAKICDLAILASGILLLAAGTAYILGTGFRRAALMVGAVAAAGFAMTLFIGVLTGAIPCSGPS